MKKIASIIFSFLSVACLAQNNGVKWDSKFIYSGTVNGLAGWDASGVATTFTGLSFGSSSLTSLLKHNFTPTTSNAGLNVGELSGDPSMLFNGDIWYNLNSGILRVRKNGATSSVITSSTNLTSGRLVIGVGASNVSDDIDLTFTGGNTLNTPALVLTSSLVNNESEDQVLVRNSITGDVEYRSATGLGGSGLDGSTGAVDNAILRSDGTGGSTVQPSQVTIDDSGNLETDGALRSANIFALQADGANDASMFTVNWITNVIGNGGTLNWGVDIFLSDTGVELEDKSAIVSYYVLLTKADGSDSVLKGYRVGYRKDGVADPVQVGTEDLFFNAGNVTPTVSFSIISGGLVSISINDNSSGGWKAQVWAEVIRL